MSETGILACQPGTAPLAPVGLGSHAYVLAPLRNTGAALPSGAALTNASPALGRAAGRGGRFALAPWIRDLGAHPGGGFTGRLLREPLLHFALAGGLLFLAARLHASAVDQHRIVVDPARVAKIEETYRLQYGAPPSPDERETLVRAWIESEALYREGVARGVDQDDEIIRRRVIQKMQFLTQDLAAPPEPSAAELRAYYQSHQARYRTEPRVSFSHIFFSPDGRGEAGARAAALHALAALTPDVLRAPGRGDPFSDRYDYALMNAADATRLFGDAPMARALFSAPVGAWSGPYRSGYGWHLARVDARTASDLPPFETVEARVRDDAMADARAGADARALAALEASYTVVRADRKPAT